MSTRQRADSQDSLEQPNDEVVPYSDDETDDELEDELDQSQEQLPPEPGVETRPAAAGGGEGFGSLWVCDLCNDRTV